MNTKQYSWKSAFLGVTATGAESWEERGESVKQYSCAFLLTVYGVLTVSVLGGEASCSLFISTGVLQFNVSEFLLMISC